MNRANSKSALATHGRIMEADDAVLMECAKIGQAQPGASLVAIIDVVAQRHPIWSLMSEFATSIAMRHGESPAMRNNQGQWKRGKRNNGRKGEEGGEKDANFRLYIEKIFTQKAN